ncbi:MAG TPA: methylglyoxal synthase [Thermoflexus sp.]|nr:methylglyoxal synthase [Thermoflexus sp.]
MKRSATNGWLQALGTASDLYPHERGPCSLGIHAMTKRIAMIAHDGKKKELVEWARRERDRLARYHLVATATTGRTLQEALGLEVTCVRSGPQGGDAQIAAMVVEGRIDAVIFLVDPLYAHPHEPDIRTVMRLCNVHNVPLATNLATASMVLRGLEEA